MQKHQQSTFGVNHAEKQNRPAKVAFPLWLRIVLQCV